MTQDRLERQIRFITYEGQRRLKTTKVALVGNGGLGSHVIQQLAFLGVENITVVDKDVADITNLNRLVGAHYDDHLIPLSKVDIATRLANEIDPEIRLTGIQKNLISEEGFEAIKGADFVFGCVDHDGPRLVLTELCSAYKKPYLDLASEIIIDPKLEYGGRVCFSDKGHGCLMCQDLISAEEAAEYFMSKESRNDRRKIYGIPIDQLQDSGPSVITINGVVASLATTEFLVHVTGLRQPQNLLIYYGSTGKVFAREFQQTDCYYCIKLYGLGKNADVERYFRLLENA
jgi:hypothetical protein